MSARGFRRPYARQRRESDEGEEEGFLYCLMYYFGEYLTGIKQAGRQRMLSVLSGTYICISHCVHMSDAAQ